MSRKTLLTLAIVGIGFGVALDPIGVQAMLSFTPPEAVVPINSGEEQDEFHQTYPLTSTGRVSLENLNGSVQIKVWDREAVQVDAIRRATRRERLEEARIDIHATAESIRIKTLYPEYTRTADEDKTRQNSTAVDYTITVPRKVRLESIELVNGALTIDGAEGSVKASSINGRLVARNLSGDTRLSTVNGSLEATFAQLSEASPITLNSVNGHLNVVIPSDSNTVIRATTVHGSITNDFGLDVLRGEYVGHELYGQLGSGGAKIKLGNVNGGISLKHAQDGKKLSPAVCLLPDKVKEKTKHKIERDVRRASAAKRAETAEERREVLREARERRQEELELARELRASEQEIRREVERAILEAQREIERAQREIERETQRAIRNQVRAENRKITGRGVGGIRLIDRESKTFAISGRARINVGTFDGGVTVRSWDKPEVMYTATKRAETDEELKQIAIQTEQQGSAVSIIARSDLAGSASLEVFVPRNTDLHVSSADGQLDVEGVSGTLTLRTGDGSIDVRECKGRLEVNTGDGHIRVANFDGQVDARSGDGAIALEGKFAQLTARTGGGSITLAVPAGSNFTVETNAESISNEGLEVAEDVAPSPRLKRWRVGRGGQVFLLTTGDGRIILRTL